MGSKVKLAVCTLNQWVLDFQGNFENIKQAITEAHLLGAKYCLTPELSITGYGCEDHFYEDDTMLHSWEVLKELMQLDETKNMICDVGMPVLHKSVRYNCRVLFMYKKIILIRPKKSCCNQGNFRELRWFVPWQKKKVIENCILPDFIQDLLGQSWAPIGDAVVRTRDTCVGVELCEELWTAESSHVAQGLDGVEIFTNGSGSHSNLRKNDVRLNLITSATSKVGGVYMFSNQSGCDGARLLYDGGSMVFMNGKPLVQGSSFSLKNVEVSIATVDLDDVRSYRTSISSNSMRAAQEEPFPSIWLTDFSLSPRSAEENLKIAPTQPIPWENLTAEEEIELGPSCWLWDYLRKSGQSGFFLPLSGGIDSSSVACIVHAMCIRVHKEVELGNQDVLSAVRRIVSDDQFQCTSPQDFCNRILTTCYMASENSSGQTKKHASSLAKRLGSNHIELNIDIIVNALLTVFTAVTGFIPKFKVNGGTSRENLAMQNVQARVRMVLAYLFAQLLQWVRGKPGGLLVLGSANVDESLRGYYTKYDCSSADINPIGGISKSDLKSFMIFFAEKYGIVPLEQIILAPPTAELVPLKDGQIAQTDEEDMGMSYEELSVFGKLRKISNCGPYSMFSKLVHLWKHRCTPLQVAQKVKHFFTTYSINRHKMTTLTPSMHAENYSPDDNRFDLRPFLYNSKWTWQFRNIDQQASVLEESLCTEV